MAVSLLIIVLKTIMMSLTFHTNSHVLELLNKNGVVERKNRVLEELSMTMINEMNLPKYCWEDAINTACHVLNRIVIRPILDKTPYELLKGRKPNLSYVRVLVANALF